MACLISAFPTTPFVRPVSLSSDCEGLVRRRQSAWVGETRDTRGRRPRSVTEALSVETTSTSSVEPADQKEPPVIELEFFSPQSTSDSQTLSAVSGEKNLRKFMLENKLELYAFYVLQGSELLSEKTDAEYNKLKKKPDSWRLACQVIVGNKSNSGKVVVQRLPQKK